MNNIGKHLRELRKKEDLSIRALAERVGISYNTLASYERDKIVPTINNVMKICDYFKVPAEYLIHGKKILTDFNDTELLTLFREVDEYENIDREVVKELLRNITGILKREKGFLRELKGSEYTPERNLELAVIGISHRKKINRATDGVIIIYYLLKIFFNYCFTYSSSTYFFYCY